MADVLIFDDDPTIGQLVSEILHCQGLTASHFISAEGIQQIVMDSKPRLVILDIMMPGIDGLSACKALRANPLTRRIKIAMLTAKDFALDRDLAKKHGADLFVNKPFDAMDLAQKIAGLLGFTQADPGAQPPAPPLIMTLLEGGAVLQIPDLWVFFDAGAGTKTWLGTQSSVPSNAWILFTRYHPETTAEFSACGRLLAEGCRLSLGGPDEADTPLQRLAPRLYAGLLPSQRATPFLYPQREGQFHIAEGILGAARFTQHPGTCLAYRLELHGRILVYCPCHEVNPDPAGWHLHEHDKFRTFFKGADLLAHGYRRSIADPKPKDMGPCGAWEPVVKLAQESHAKRLALIPLPGALSLDAKKIAEKTNGMVCEPARFNEPYIL